MSGSLANRHLGRHITLLIGVLTVLNALGAPSIEAGTGIVTWIRPGNEKNLLEVRSAIEGPTAQLVRTEDDQTIESASKLRKAGWLISEQGALETPMRESNTDRISIRVRGLPAGTHEVFVRFHSKAKTAGQQWWEFSYAGIEGAGNKTNLSWDAKGARLIKGLGGYDTENVWEMKLGEVGGEEKPATEVGVWIEKYAWTRIARILAIRVETTPSADYARTRGPEFASIREAILANGPKDSAGNPVYGVQAIPACLKVRPKTFQIGAYLEDLSLADVTMESSISLQAARGEYESRQVLIFSPKQNLGKVKLSASGLTSKNGESIPAEEITFCPVGYVLFERPFDMSLHGWWPDPILTFANETDIAQHDLQTLWYRVHVPRDARPGVYEGSFTIAPSNAPNHEMPVRVEILEFTLPKMPHLPVVAGCLRQVDFELKYGFNPSNIYSGNGFDPEDEESLQKWADLGVTAINVGYVNPEATPSKEEMTKLLDGIGERLEVLERFGLRDRAYCYMFDEATPDRWPVMREVSQAIEDRFPELLLLTTASDGTFGEKSGLTAIDGWCPSVKAYRPEEARQARERGKQVWWYVCNSPMKPFPNLFLVNSAMDTRLLMGAMAFAYETDGFLYYSMLKDWHSPQKIEQVPYTKWQISGYLSDGNLYHRGPDGEPLPSLRMEAIRDGLEDYEYLYLARDRIRRLSGKNADLPPEDQRLIREIESYFQLENPLVRSFTDYSQNPAELRKMRTRIADFLSR